VYLATAFFKIMAALLACFPQTGLNGSNSICSGLILASSSSVLVLLLSTKSSVHHKFRGYLVSGFAAVWWTHLCHTLTVNDGVLGPGNFAVVWALGSPVFCFAAHAVHTRISAKRVFTGMWQRFLSATRTGRLPGIGKLQGRRMTGANKLRQVDLSGELVGMTNTGLSILFQVLGTARVETITGIDARSAAGALHLNLNGNALRPQHMQLILAAVSTNPMLTIAALSFNHNRFLLRPPSQLLELEQQLEQGTKDLVQNARAVCSRLTECSYRNRRIQRLQLTQDCSNISSVVTSAGQPVCSTSLQQLRRGSSSSLIPQLTLHMGDAAGPNTGTMASLKRRLWGLGSFLAQYEPLVFLGLHGVELQLPVFDALCDALRLSSVKNLDISSCSLTATHAASLEGLLEDSNTLRKVSISGNPKFGAGGAVVLARGIASITCRAQLDFFDASWCRLRQEGVIALLESVDTEANGIRVSPPLLDLHSNEMAFPVYRQLCHQYPGMLEDLGCLGGDAGVPLEETMTNSAPIARHDANNIVSNVLADLKAHSQVGLLVQCSARASWEQALSACVETSLGLRPHFSAQALQLALPPGSVSNAFFDQLIFSVVNAMQAVFNDVSAFKIGSVVARLQKTRYSILAQLPESCRNSGSSLYIAALSAEPRSTSVSTRGYRSQSLPISTDAGSTRSQPSVSSKRSFQSHYKTQTPITAAELSPEILANGKSLRKNHSAHTILRMLSSKQELGNWVQEHKDQSTESSPRNEMTGTHMTGTRERNENSDEKIATIISRNASQAETTFHTGHLINRESSLPAAALIDDQYTDSLRRQRAESASEQYFSQALPLISGQPARAPTPIG
jgi:hypothetical protein